ncbi:N-6 DNA methylase [Synechococcus sp. CBW1002]|uniref:Eco57I restriction-modification methylase domain-containing protein n=1 Tax=unclassified Synechococcus TaxID=2626047 RepID=UPI0018CDD940|nr:MULTISPECIES: DNA methyltransferase [unclassified Synechococcus]QPN58526.1 N-6 DNA methylase [Synechococcus sp. CBW1002]QPN65251.1 N-6 DNA methylase [Synechococcus sp. CBW1006]
MAYGTPGIHTHEQWLGLVQPVGLVVAPAVLNKLELFPNQGTAYLSTRQRQLEALLEERDTAAGEPIQVVPGFGQLATELLDWGEADLLSADQLQTIPEVVLSEYGETLRPTHGVPKFEGEGLQALVLDLTALGEWGRAFDQPWNPTGNGWDATPQQRFERLLKETEHPIGILFNGADLRLVHAPRGESSGWLTMPLEPMAEVAGRPMLGALELLLGVDRLFGGNPEQRLPALLAASRKNQSEVSTRLAEQVLEALWELLLGFDDAERLAQDAGRTVLGDLPHSDEGQQQLYGGLITVLLRLVFLLYAEDEALMPADSLYGQHYSVSALADRLRQERVDHQGAMSDRRGGWASLLSLFRLVYDGGGADPAYLPARHGELFDPDAYPFLEGRDPYSSYQDAILSNLPAISDDVVEKVLSKLLWLDGERLSYRALDVEQIGSVYEGIMGFRVEQAHGPSVGITYRPPRQKITITVVVNADQLLAQSAGKRESWLDEQAGVKLKLPASVKRELKSASSLAELCLALDKKLSPHTPRGLQPGSLILQPTAERRRSGSHYTPRALTEPIVAEAFRPWLQRCNHQPTAEQILDLKVCDPAMGSGAFLVAVCRYLAGWLVQAWERDGFPEGFRQDADKDTVARRLVAQQCLYGVDKNPFAVNLARLSLWLVTLSKDMPFTFVDHALKCGDSLVGYSVKEIQAAMQEVQLALFNEQNQIIAQLGTSRQSSFAEDSLSDESYDRKKALLLQQIKAADGLRQVGDLMVAAFFDAKKPKERADKQQVYLAMLSGAFADDGLQDSVQEIRERLAAGEKGITPFHWQLEFPEVFREGRGGFDVFVGNPPFAGKNTIAEGSPEGILDWFKQLHPESHGNADLVAHFFRRCFDLLRPSGSLGLIATNTIAQGDTRSTGLRWICLNGGTIYAARKRYKWPGVAAVVVSVVHLRKGAYSGAKLLERRPVEQITAFLFANGGHEDPKQLVANAGKSFVGSYVLGMGFTFDDSSPADDDTPGIPSPITTMERLIGENPKNAEVILPYIGGEEVNSSPTHAHHRYVINFGERSEEECRREWPELMQIVESKVKPERLKVNDKGAKQKWWLFIRPRPELNAAVEGKAKVIVTARHQPNWQLAFMPPTSVFSEAMVVFALESAAWMLLCQSDVHELWARFLGSSMKDDLRYTPSDCFETFPFPAALLDANANDPTLEDTRQSLETSGEHYHQFRAELMVSNNEGLTSTYNRFHDPAETSPGLLELRRLHGEMDQAVLQAYGWSDVPTGCGFGLDYLDTEEDAQLPDELQECIDSGELFFSDAGDALDFQGQLEAYGAITGRRKLPWRYRWPDAVRDDVLARLLALNAERYEEEVAQGLHGGSRRGGSSSGGSGTGRRRGRPPRNPQPESGQTAQIGLAL